MNTGAGMMMSAAGQGIGKMMSDSSVGMAVTAGKKAANDIFGNAGGAKASELVVSGAKGIKAGAQNIGQNIMTGAHNVASVARDVARDVSKYSPIK